MLSDEVFVVMKYGYESEEVLGVYRSRERADAAMTAYAQRGQYYTAEQDRNGHLEYTGSSYDLHVAIWQLDAPIEN